MNLSKVVKIASIVIGIVSVAAAVAAVVSYFLKKKDEDFCSYIECEDEPELEEAEA